MNALYALVLFRQICFQLSMSDKNDIASLSLQKLRIPKGCAVQE